MARRSSSQTVNKSDHIRGYIKLNPSAGPKEIRQALLHEGLDVSAALVNRLKYGPSSKKKKRRGRRTTAEAASNGGGQLSLDHLLAAKRLVNQLGSIESAKQAVDALARLS